MQVIASLLVTLITAVAFAQTPAIVPTIAASDFTLGRHWTWDYFDAEGEVYSTEQYTVVEVRGDVVTLEMSSSYGGSFLMTPHHRIVANVGECLAAYSNPAAKKPWEIRMFSLEDGQWVEFDPPSPLAFEEKFNCNPNVQTAPHAPYLTVFSIVNDEAVFQQKLWRKLESSWFTINGNDHAVAARKDFNPDTTSAYFMVRRP